MKTFAFIRKITHSFQNPHQNYDFCVSETFRLKEQIENLIKI